MRIDPTMTPKEETYQAVIPPKPISDEEFDKSDAKPTRNWAGSRRVINKKVSISADENIIPESDAALELGKSISLTIVAKEEAVRQVHVVHERIVTESEPEPARRRPSGIAFRDTPGVSNKLSPDRSQKLKGVKTLTPKEQLDANIMKALKAIKNSSRSQPHIRGSSKGTGTGTKLGVPDEENVTSKVKVNVTLDWGSEEESEYTKEDDADENIEWVHIDEEEEKNNDDDDKILTPIPKTPSVVLAITLPPPPTVSSISHVQLQTTTSFLSPPITIEALHVTTILDPLPSGRCTSKGASETYKRTNTEVVSDFATLVIQSTIKNALEKTLLPAAQSSSQALSSLKAAESLFEYELKTILFDKMDKSRSYLTHDKHQDLFDALLNSIILDDAVACGQADSVKVLRKIDHGNKDPLARPNQCKKTKRSRIKEFEPSKKSSTSKESSKGKSPAKTSKSRKSMTAEEPVEEPVFKMAFDDIKQIINDVANDADQPPDDLIQTKDNDPKKDWFKQPPRPPTPDQEWNKRQVVVDQPEQPWFNNMVSAAKDPLTFNELIATLIDFSKYALNRLKIDSLTQAHLVRPVYKLLKGTYTSSIKLEYNIEECFKALEYKLDWNNPEGDNFPFDLTKPLPLKGRTGRLTIAAEYFFNNDLEILESSDPEKKYTTSITKTKATCDIIDFVKALHMFSRSLIIKRHVEDLQLSVKSYQKKLNIIEPQKTFLGIKVKELYTPSFDPPGDVYKDMKK
nr:hypothetical protein [Tanacetum cinerariifolium]